eukprot:PhF_6_TR44163/c1_g2_i1/m.67617
MKGRVRTFNDLNSKNVDLSETTPIKRRHPSPKIIIPHTDAAVTSPRVVSPSAPSSPIPLMEDLRHSNSDELEYTPVLPDTKNGSFTISNYVPFSRRASIMHDKNESRYLISRIFHGVLMIDHINVSAVTTWILAYHYVPAIAVLFALLINCSLQEVHTHFIPMMLSTTSSGITTFFLGWCPHIAFMMSLLILGYKVMGVVADAMIDSVKTVKDEKTQCCVLYYCLLTDVLGVFTNVR